jgi:hypothetical protein
LRRVLVACCRAAGPARAADAGSRKAALRQALSGIGLKALSLSLACAAWAYVRFAGNSMIAAFVDRHWHSLTTCVK